ncbi:hypothetical protein J2S74_001271 [Evansella vedderi]|uniref:Uncharacterized protein n=1 Tax=Evansella vedderi TaxID=38282 RepID=A0ABT9ZSR4_9BACI|nr:hypothetical protein [Evansella vedderi]
MGKLHKFLIILFLVGSVAVVVVYTILTILAVIYGAE